MRRSSSCTGSWKPDQGHLHGQEILGSRPTWHPWRFRKNKSNWKGDQINGLRVMISFFHDPCCLNFMKQFYKILCNIYLFKSGILFCKTQSRKWHTCKIVLSQAYGNYCPKFPAHLCRIMNIYREKLSIQPLKSHCEGDHHSVNRFGKLLFFHLKLWKKFLCYWPACYIFTEEVMELLTHCGGPAS